MIPVFPVVELATLRLCAFALGLIRHRTRLPEYFGHCLANSIRREVYMFYREESEQLMIAYRLQPG